MSSPSKRWLYLHTNECVTRGTAYAVPVALRLTLLGMQVQSPFRISP
jgi:hypothetical protein